VVSTVVSTQWHSGTVVSAVCTVVSIVVSAQWHSGEHSGERSLHSGEHSGECTVAQW